MLATWSHWLLTILLSVTVVGISLRAEEPAPQDASPELKKALSEVIESQLQAFRERDYAKAYGFASSEFHESYSVSDFETMVKTSYPVIAGSSSADFSGAFNSGDDALIDVHVTSLAQKRDGQFRYRLHKEDGKWRVTGVIEIKPTGLSV